MDGVNLAYLVQCAKLRVRKMRSDVLDKDIEQLIFTAVADMKRVGIAEKHFNPVSDALIKEAILTYVNANYGLNPEADRLNASYDSLVAKIKGSRRYYE